MTNFFKTLSRRKNDKNAEGNREESRSLKRRVSISNSASTYVLRKRDETRWITKNEIHVVVFQRSALENELLHRVYGEWRWNFDAVSHVEERKYMSMRAMCPALCLRMRMYVTNFPSPSFSSFTSHQRISTFSLFSVFAYFFFLFFLHFSICSI